jgi:hypothetical protein
MEDLLKLFRDEVTTASWSFFAWKAFNNIASADEDVYRAINETALTWNIVTHSLQSTFFITLGRLFDVDGDAFSVHALLRESINNIDQFSNDALRTRKINENKGMVPDWLDKYIEDAYEPTEQDFLRLRGEISKVQAQYEEIYRPIRNKVIAHKDRETLENVNELFGKTNVTQIQDFIIFLHQIENIVFQLLYNGKLTSIGDHAFDEEDYVHQDVNKLLTEIKGLTRRSRTTRPKRVPLS